MEVKTNLGIKNFFKNKFKKTRKTHNKMVKRFVFSIQRRLKLQKFQRG
jgi:hypothetical protein